MHKIRLSTQLPVVGACLAIVLLLTAQLIIPLGASAQTQVEIAPATAETLAAQQTVNVRVGRWDPIQEAYTDWVAVGGSFLINSTGTVTLPLIGSVRAAGMTLDELGRDISQRVQDRMGLEGGIQAIVTISAFAPIYVLGDVRSPGAYPHMPRMTVLQALSVAGGISGANPMLVRGERSALTSLGSYRVMELELLRRLATLARLEAEDTGSEMIPPAELLSATMGSELIDQERQIMEAQQLAYVSSIAQIDELEVLLQERINRLSRQAKLRQKQLVLLDEELKNAASLVNRGLSTASRQSTLQRNVADQQVRLLEVETSQLIAEQQLNETGRDRLNLMNQRGRERVQGLQDQRAAIGEIRIRMETEAALFAESVRTGNGLVELSALSPPVLQITRTEFGGSATFLVSRDDLLEGGDVLEVILDSPSPNDSIPVRRLSPAAVSAPELSDPSGPLSSNEESKPRQDTSKIPPS